MNFLAPAKTIDTIAMIWPYENSENMTDKRNMWQQKNHWG